MSQEGTAKENEGGGFRTLPALRRKELAGREETNTTKLPLKE